MHGAFAGGGGGTYQMCMPCTALTVLCALRCSCIWQCLNARSSAHLRTWLLHRADFHLTHMVNHPTPGAFAGGGGTCQMSIPCMTRLSAHFAWQFSNKGS